MNPTTIFTNIADFRGYTEGLLPDTIYEQLAPSIRTVASDMKHVIGTDIFDTIAGFSTGSSAAEKEGKDLLKTALANGAMAKYAIFAAVKKNGSDASMYKYQHEEIKDHYYEAYARAMDELLEWLDANPDTGETPAEAEGGEATGGWKRSDAYTERQALPLKDAREFDKYYGIGKSSFFFSKIVFLLRSIWTLRVQPLLSGSDDEKAVDLAKRILAYRVMAAAVMQFDVTELPRSIRWDYNHEYTKGSDMQDRDKLASQLSGQADSWEAALAIRLQAGTSEHIINDQNAEDNKFYSML